MLIQILKILPILFLYLVASLTYLFCYWRRLKEDYTSTTIFASSFVMLISVLVVSIITHFFYNSPGFVFWLGVLGYLLSFVFSVKKYRLRHIESFEASGVGLLAVIFAYNLIFLLSHLSIFAVINLLLPIFSFILFNVVDRRYKRFTWYSSGRVGFAGFTSLVFYFLMRSFIVVFTPAAMLSFSGSSYLGKIDILFSGLAAAILLFYTYWLAKTK